MVEALVSFRLAESILELTRVSTWRMRASRRPSAALPDRLFCSAAGYCSARLRSAQKALKMKPEWSPKGFKIDHILLPGGLLAPLGLENEAPFLGLCRPRAVPNFFFSAPEAIKSAARGYPETF